jgi:NSS family neurotransmitter:Na+ symporter
MTETVPAPPSGPPYTRWTSTSAFLLAAVGAGIGLGSIWRFPYVTGANGGGAFVLIYLLTVFGVVMPVLVAELIIGRRGGGSPSRSIFLLAREAGASPLWRVIGHIGMIATFLVVSYSSVFASWTVPYMARLGSGAFANATPAAVRAAYDAFIADPIALIAWHGAFTIVVATLVARGLRDGLEWAYKVLVPLFLVVLAGLVVYCGMHGAFSATVHFLANPDFAKLRLSGVFRAIGSAFFNVTVGFGIMMVFGAYLDRKAHITRAAVAIVAVDAAVSILVCLAVFPIVFAYYLNPAEGPGLVFVTMMTAFAQMPAGQVVGTLFFLLLTLASLTSALAALEPLVAWAVERHGWQRAEAAIGFAAGAWLVGLAISFSFNIARNFHPLAAVPGFAKATMFQVIDSLTADFLVPVAGVSLLIFSGWRLTREIVHHELAPISPLWLNIWRFLVRWLAPATLLAILALKEL